VAITHGFLLRAAAVAAPRERRGNARSPRSVRLRLAATAIIALALLVTAAPAVLAGGLPNSRGLPNCVDVPAGPGSGQVACWENVWADGVQVRMVFLDQQFTGPVRPDRLGAFYVLAPQKGTPQGKPPKTFAHDHVVDFPSAGGHGARRLHLEAYFAVCSELGIVSGACVPTFTVIPGLGTLPFAKTVNGRALTSARPIRAAVAGGLITLIDTGSVILATIPGLRRGEGQRGD